MAEGITKVMFLRVPGVGRQFGFAGQKLFAPSGDTAEYDLTQLKDWAEMLRTKPHLRTFDLMLEACSRLPQVRNDAGDVVVEPTTVFARYLDEAGDEVIPVKNEKTGAVVWVLKHPPAALEALEAPEASEAASEAPAEEAVEAASAAPEASE